MKQTILIVDDDEKLNRLLEKFLGDFGMAVQWAVTPSAGFKLLKESPPDLIILDIMLPEMDGFEVCKTIRRTSRIPIIMLTARGDLTDKVVGLELGADDYLPKPFEPRELVARIQSVLRRTSPLLFGKTEKFGSLEIDFARQTGALDGHPLDLTTSEYTALCFLAVNTGKVLDRDQILQELSGMDCEAFNRTVDVVVSRLRQKLKDDPKNPRFIKTIWGSGYLFLGGSPEA
ncbi:MAG: response regulator transcription factor [Proteobacteria bacterium]|nr:response regulator transcription factor [Desulfobacula sp.]MBU3952947.1 response regulator transcription factor [Pseudomonadota bacterium]MBU4133411.1 response regulator transcription factor [Pseudomonadota bacterium]